MNGGIEQINDKPQEERLGPQEDGDCKSTAKVNSGDSPAFPRGPTAFSQRTAIPGRRGPSRTSGVDGHKIQVNIGMGYSEHH